MHLKGNKALQDKIADYINGAANTAVARHSQTLTTWHAVQAIAASMGSKPEDILEVVPNAK